MTSPETPVFSEMSLMGRWSAVLRMLAPVASSPAERELVHGGRSAQHREAAAGDDALFDSRARRRKRVLYAVLLFLELHFRRRADLDDRHAAGQLRQPLLQLLAVEVRSRLFDLRLDLVDAAGDGALGAGAVNERRLFLGGDDAAGASEVGHFHRIQLAPHFFADDLAARKDPPCLRASPLGPRPFGGRRIREP